MLWKVCGALVFILILASTNRFVVREGHPDLTQNGTERLWKRLPWTGVIIGFHENFQPMLLATYWEGQPHGLEISWYRDGTREREIHFHHGVYHGTAQTWHENGRIKTWRSYIHGLADGEQWTWGPLGQVLEYNLYQLDKEIAHKTWTFDGKPFHNYVYQNAEKVGIMGEPFCRRKTQL